MKPGRPATIDSTGASRTTAIAVPLVTVILPTFNGEQRIRRAIDTVLSQDYSDLKLIVVDDASTDATAEVVEAVKDPRVQLIRLEANSGPYSARSAALDASTGELIAFIDDDDEWRPGKLRLQVDLLEARPEIALVHGAVVDVFPDGASRFRALHRRANEYRENLCQDRLTTSTVVVRRSAIEAAGGFDTSLRAFGDWDLWVRILKTRRAASITKPIADINLRMGSIQRGSVEAFEQARKIVLQKRRDELEATKLVNQAESRFHYAVASKLQQAGRSQQARGRALASMRSSPNTEALALTALTFLPQGAAQRARLQLRRARSLIRF